MDAANVGLPIAIRFAIDALPAKAWNTLLLAALGYFGLTAVQAVSRYLWRVYLIGTSHLVAQDLRVKLYDQLQSLPVGYYQGIRTGDLMSRATNDIESVRMAVGPGVLVVLDTILIFAMITPAMLFLSPKLTLLAFVLYPLVPWLTARLGDRIDSLFETLQAHMSQMGAFAQEAFQGIRLIKSLVLESTTEKRFARMSEQYRLSGVIQARYEAVLSPTLGLLTNFGTFLILIFGGMDVLSGAITLGTFVAFQRFVVQLSWPMEAIGWAVTMNRDGLAAHRRLMAVFSQSRIQQCTADWDSGEKESPPLLKIRQLDIRPEKSSFSLSVGGLEIPKGGKIGIVGPVGSGKSTLFHGLLRLDEPAPGSVFLNGRDICSIPLFELRSMIGSVEQQVFLFSESVAENIAMGARPRPKRNEIIEAAEAARMRDEIEALPQGFDTLLGERGINLSGGQKQRLALARALVRRPTLLLLDDAFSSVDVAVENQIISNLMGLPSQLAFLFASHRMSIMPLLDEVWVMDGGNVTDRGNHRTLLHQSRLYQTLWEKSLLTEAGEIPNENSAVGGLYQ